MHKFELFKEKNQKRGIDKPVDGVSRSLPPEANQETHEADEGVPIIN